MAVLPASLQISLPRLKTVTGATNAALASEQEFKDKFPDCQTGAMPHSEICTTCPFSRTRV